MSDIHYIENLQIEGAGAKAEGLHNYFGSFTSTGLNLRNFSLSPKTMANIVKQANEGTELRKSHQLYSDPIGKFTSAYVRDGKGHGQFFIREGLEGPKSNDVIKMIDSEIMNSMSIGFAHTDKTRVMCDTCRALGEENQMKPKFTWFSYYFECDEGHILGKKAKVNKKEMVCTATYEGEVKLREISVVGSGADPSAKIRKKLQEELQAGTIELADLPIFSESMNIELSRFNQALGLDSPEPTPQPYSIPPKRRTQMSEPTGNEALQAMIDELNNTVETLTAEKVELEKRPTLEQHNALETELESVTTQLAVKTAELETLKAESETLSKDGKEARDLERARGHSYLKEYYGEDYKEQPECVTHIQNLDNPDASVSVLRSLADGFRSMAVSKRPAGRQSRIEDVFTPKKTDAKDFKFKQGANVGVSA